MTKTLKADEVHRDWYIIDAKNFVLGRLATHSAVLISGKNKPTYSPNIDNGDHVIIINTAHVAMTSNKFSTKKYYSHSGYPGGLKIRTAAQLHKKDSTTLIHRAVSGMLAKNKLRSLRIKRLHLYPGNDHLHSAQKIIKYNL